MSLGSQATKNVLNGVMLHAPTGLTNSATNLAKENPWAVTFGQPRSDAEYVARPYAGVRKSTLVMPEAYKGRSEFIENTMFLLAHSNNSFVTSVLLPMVTRDGALQSNWSRWEFPTQMPDVIASRGTPRLVRASQIEGFDIMTQYGLGMTLEHGFMKSDLGMQHYRMHMRQINQSVSEGLQLQGIYKILTCEDWAKKYMLVNGSTGRSGQMRRVMARELNRWAILQKNRNAWTTLNDMIDAENDIINPNVRLTTYLIDNSVKSLIKHSYDQTTVSLRGAKAARNIDDTLEGFRLTDNGDVVFVTRGYLTAGNGGVLSPMKRQAQLGQCEFTMDPDNMEVEGYSSKLLNTTIYDESRDNWSTITGSQMLENCNRFDPKTGQLWGFNSPAAMRYSRDNFSAEEERHDFLHFTNSNGDLEPVTYFGQIDLHHMDVDDYMRAGDIALASLAKRLGQKPADFIRVTQRAIGYINITRDYKYDANYKALLDAILDANDGKVNDAQQVRFDGGIGSVTATATNSFGSYDLPSEAETATAISTTDYTNSFVLPPTHAFSYGGLKTIAQASNGKDGGAELGFNKEAFKAIAEFVTMVDNMVPVLQRFYPDSIFLNPEYALPHHANPTAHDVFVESLVLSSTPVTQLYFNSGSATGGAGSGLTGADLFGATLESEILQGLDANIQSVVGAPDETAFYRQASIGGNIGEPTLDSDGNETIAERVHAYTSQLRVTNADYTALRASGDEELLAKVVRGIIARKVILTLFSVTTPTWESYEKIMDTMDGQLGQTIGNVKDTNGIVDIVPLFNSTAQINALSNAVLAQFNSEQGLRNSEIKVNRAIKKNITATITSLNKELAKARNELDNIAAVVNGTNGTGLKKYADVAASGRGKMVLTPLTMTHAAIVGYVEDLGKSKIKIKVLPASFSDPREVMNVAAFKDNAAAFKSVVKSQGSIQSSIGGNSGVDSIHGSSRHADELKGNVGYNSVMRSVVNRQRITSADYERSQSTINNRLVMGDADLRAEAEALGSSNIGGGIHSDPANFSNPYLRAQESVYGANVGDDVVGSTYGKRAREDRSTLADTSLWGGKSLLEEEERSMQRARLSEAVTRESTVSGSSVMDTFLNRRLTANFAKLYAGIARSSDLDITRWLATIFLGTPVTKDALKSTLKFNLFHPFRYILSRPHARYTTVTVVKMLPGLETGQTNFGHVMAIMGDDPIQRCHTVNLTYWSSALIRNPKNININHNCAVVDYHGGLGSGFFKRGQYNPQQGTYGASQHDSIFVIALPVREKIEANPLNITGRFDWVSEEGRQMGDAKSDLSYSTAAFYNGYWGWQQYRWNSDMTIAGPGPMRTHHSVPNAYCFASMTRYTNGTVTSNTGHWPNHTVGENCAAARKGAASFMNAPVRGASYGIAQGIVV